MDELNITTKNVPYVYKCVHKITNQVYIGARCKNVLPPDLDFPKYKTSSKIVKNAFSEFNFEILFVGFDNKIVFEVENMLIEEQWKIDKSASLNLYLNGKFNRAGTKTPPEVKLKLSKIWLGRKHSEDSKIKMSIASKGRKRTEEHESTLRASINNSIRTPESRAKASKSQLGKRHSKESKKKIGLGQLGKKRNKETGEKISKQTTGKPKSKTFVSCIFCKKQTTLNVLMRWHKLCKI
jgi:hypothetical protein